MNLSASELFCLPREPTEKRGDIRWENVSIYLQSAVQKRGSEKVLASRLEYIELLFLVVESLFDYVISSFFAGLDRELRNSREAEQTKVPR